MQAVEAPWFCQKCYRLVGQIITMPSVEGDYYKCPRCGTEVWLDYNAPVLNEADPPVDRGTPYVSRSLPERYKVPPGGAKSGKRAKKKGTQIYIDDRFEG